MEKLLELLEKEVYQYRLVKFLRKEVLDKYEDSYYIYLSWHDELAAKDFAKLIRFAYTEQDKIIWSDFDLISFRDNLNALRFNKAITEFGIASNFDAWVNGIVKYLEKEDK